MFLSVEYIYIGVKGLGRLYGVGRPYLDLVTMVPVCFSGGVLTGKMGIVLARWRL